MNPADLLLALPLAGFVLTLFLPRDEHQTIRIVTLLVALATFVVSLGLAAGFHADVAGHQFITDFIWITTPQIHYRVGVDGISIWLVLLSTS